MTIFEYLQIFYRGMTFVGLLEHEKRSFSLSF